MLYLILLKFDFESELLVLLLDLVDVVYKLSVLFDLLVDLLILAE